MSEVTISAEKLAKYISLEKDNERLKTEMESKNKAIDSERDKRKTALEEVKELKKSITEFEIEKETFESERKKYENFDEVSENAKKWAEHQTKIGEDRNTKISELTEKLGSEIIESKKSFLEKLDDDAKLTYLTELSELDQDFNNTPGNEGGNNAKTISMEDLSKLASENPQEYNSTRDLIDSGDMIIEN